VTIYIKRIIQLPWVM